LARTLPVEIEEEVDMETELSVVPDSYKESTGKLKKFTSTSKKPKLATNSSSVSVAKSRVSVPSDRYLNKFAPIQPQEEPYKTCMEVREQLRKKVHMTHNTSTS